MMIDLSGQLIKGYQLSERIGAGGFGAVYKALQSTVGREVAVKVILPAYANQSEFIRRFEAEAQLVARLEHLHIVPLYDYWRDPDGAYLVMRWMRGGSLRDMLAKEGALGLQATAQTLNQIAAALAIAHRNNIIHRDLKPGNILLDEDKNAYLADFGIAKDISQTTGSVTNPDAIVGSPDYLSPEQARSEAVTPATDVYSLGVVLYEMLAGEHPFPNLSTVERLYKHLSDPLPEITTLDSSISDAVNGVIQRATAKDPKARYANAEEMANAFRRAAILESGSGTGSVVEILTRKEQEILHYIVEGRSNKEIAEQLFVTVATVKWYITQIYRKLHVRTRMQAIVRASELNLVVGSDSVVEVIPGEEGFSTDQFQSANPYKGLRSFESSDFRDFFGRDRLLQRLLQRLSERDKQARFLAVVGPSGSGKSSLVKAGLIPAIWRGELPGSDKWFVVEMVPGSRPLDELEVALTRIASNQTGNIHEQLQRDEFGLLRAARMVLPEDSSELCLVIDQFEEIFTLVSDESVRAHFLKLLHAAVTENRSQLRIIITLRADFYDRPLHYADFGELVRNRMETVLPMGAKELEDVIVKPAERVGATFEEGLVGTIIDDIHYQAGALPLLQYALTELFENRTGRLLTLEAYNSMGRTVGALAKHAEDLYREFGPEKQRYIQQILLRLVTLGEGTEDTRRRTAYSEFLELSPQTDILEEIIDTFVEYRLLSMDNDPITRRPIVELAHEALLREWQRLADWLTDSREHIRLQQQLSHMAQEWYASSHESSFLLRGSRLQQFEQWAQHSESILTKSESAYLKASRTNRDREAAEEKARQERETHLERRAQIFLRGLVAVFALAALIAIGLSIVAFNERDRAEDALKVSDQNFELSEARRLAGASTLLLPNLAQDAELATLLALQSLKVRYSEEADAAITQASSLLFTEAILYPPQEALFRTAALSPDESLIATGSMDGHVNLWDARTFELRMKLTEEAGFIEEVLFSPDGTQVLALSSDISGDAGYIRSWNLETGELLRERYLTEGFADHAQFTPDGTRLVIATYSFVRDPLSIYVWDADSWETLLSFDDAANVIVDQNVGGADGMAMGGEGGEFAYINADGLIVLRSWRTGEIQHLFEDIPSDITSSALTYSADGRWLAVAARQGLLLIDNEGRNISLQIVIPQGESVAGLAITPDSQNILLSGTRGLYLYDIATGQELRRFSGGARHLNPVFFRSGQRFIAVSDDGLRLWNSDLDALPTTIAVEGFFPKASADTSILASANQQLIVYDAETGHVLKSLPNDTGAFWTAFSPDNRYLFAGSPDDPAILTVWDWQAEEILWQQDFDSGIGESEFSPDGRYIVSAHNDGIIRLWDASNGDLTREFSADLPMDVFAGFSADGRLMISGGTGPAAFVWDMETGELRRSFRVNSEAGAWLMTAQISPDNRLVATLGRDSGVQIWDLATGEQLYEANTFGTRARFSHDGRYLAYTGENNNIVLVDVSIMQVTRRIYSSHPSGRRIWFSPDDRYVYMGNTDQTYSRYDVEIDDVIIKACQRLVRDLTAVERERYYIFSEEAVCP